MRKLYSVRLVAGVLGLILGLVCTGVRAADSPPLDLAEWLFVTQLGDAPKDSVVCPSFSWRPIPEGLLRSLQAGNSRFVKSTECVKVMDTAR